MLCLFFLNFKLAEWIGILWNIPLVYCFIDKGAKYSHVLSYRVDLQSLVTQECVKFLGGLMLNENYFLINHMLEEGALYKLNYPKNINVTFDIIGEGNSENADIFSFVLHHVKGLSVVKSIGPNLLKIYKDGDYNYYVYMPIFSRALIYFTNRVSMDNAISATKVDIDISTLTQVGI